jgi:hypothetical protein
MLCLLSLSPPIERRREREKDECGQLSSQSVDDFSGMNAESTACSHHKGFEGPTSNIFILAGTKCGDRNNWFGSVSPNRSLTLHFEFFYKTSRAACLAGWLAGWLRGRQRGGRLLVARTGQGLEIGFPWRTPPAPRSIPRGMSSRISGDTLIRLTASQSLSVCAKLCRPKVRNDCVAEMVVINVMLCLLLVFLMKLSLRWCLECRMERSLCSKRRGTCSGGFFHPSPNRPACGWGQGHFQVRTAPCHSCAVPRVACFSSLLFVVCRMQCGIDRAEAHDSPFIPRIGVEKGEW